MGRKILPRKEKSCETCGKIIRYLPNSRKTVKYCCRLCQNRSIKMRHISQMNGLSNKGKCLGNKNPNWKGGGLIFHCILCHKKFRIGRNELVGKKRNGIFCSTLCYNKYRALNKIPFFQDRLHRNIKRAITRHIKENKNYRRWEDILGYSTLDLMAHLEKQFKDGMTWNNYGKWHVDHVIPVSAFRFYEFNDEGFKECWKLTNLQPLWRFENISKGGTNRWKK